MTGDTIVHFSTAYQELMLARDVDEVKAVRDKAAALQLYARQQGESLEMQNAIAEIKLRAERRAGELLAEMERAQGNRSDLTSFQPGTKFSEYTNAIENAGIARITAHRWQEIASIPEEKFEQHIAEKKSRGDELTSAGMLRLAKNTTVTYQNQPGIHATRGNVPLAGTSHVYTVEKLLWPEQVEGLLESLLVGKSLHMCCGKSRLGTVRLDLFEPGVDIQADAAMTGLESESFDSVLCDPPYNGQFQWNHDLLTELARLARERIIFQHWFVPVDVDGFYKKSHRFSLSKIYLWQPRSYFGRAQIISVFDS